MRLLGGYNLQVTHLFLLWMNNYTQWVVILRGMRGAYLCAALTLWAVLTLWAALTYARCLFMAFGHTAQLRCLHTACAKQSLCSLCATRTEITLRVVHALRAPCIRGAHLCASLTYVLRTRHPCLFSNEIHFVQLTFLQQLRKVSKRSRSPTNFLIHIFNRLQCQNGER